MEKDERDLRIGNEIIGLRVDDEVGKHEQFMAHNDMIEAGMSRWTPDYNNCNGMLSRDLHTGTLANVERNSPVLILLTLPVPHQSASPSTAPNETVHAYPSAAP